MKVVSPQEQLQSGEGVFCPTEALAFLDAVDRGETDGVSCWRSPDIERRTGSSIEGRGLFAVNGIPANTLVAIKQGHILDSRQVKDHADIIQGSHQQIDRHHFIGGLTPEEVDKNLVGYNHSCNPNARVVLFKDLPLSFLVTDEVISKGDEITADYSLTQASDTHRMSVCRCGGPDCRGFVVPLWDWEDETFQREHAGQLAWFIEEMIEGRDQAEPDVIEAHSLFGIVKMAALLKLTSDEITGVLEKKEELFAQLVPSRLFRRILRGTFEENYEQSPAHRELQGLEAIRLQFATHFCVLGLSNEERQGLGIEIDPIAALRSLHQGGDALTQQQVREHLSELVEFARQLDRERNP